MCAFHLRAGSETTVITFFYPTFAQTLGYFGTCACGASGLRLSRSLIPWYRRLLVFQIKPVTGLFGSCTAPSLVTRNPGHGPSPKDPPQNYDKTAWGKFNFSEAGIMSNVSHRQRKFLECTSRIRTHGHGRRLGAKNQDPNFGPGNRSLYRRTEDKRPIFKFSPRGQ